MCHRNRETAHFRHNDQHSHRQWPIQGHQYHLQVLKPWCFDQYLFISEISSYNLILGPPFAPPSGYGVAPVIPNVPPVRPYFQSGHPNPSSSRTSGWKDPPKSGWNESPPRDYRSSPNGIVHVTKNITLKRVTDSSTPTTYLTPPPVIRREYSPSIPPVVTHSRPYHEQTVKSTPSVILKRQYDSDSEGNILLHLTPNLNAYLGPTPPPTSENEIDLTELYRRHPQLWQGFVTIKKHAAMVQLHYLSGDKILGMLFIFI